MNFGWLRRVNGRIRYRVDDLVVREGLTSTAWDFEYVIPRQEYEVGKWYRLRVRMIFKEYAGDDDVLAEVRKAQHDLGFETVSDIAM